MHVLDPQEEDKITVVPNALPLTVELLRPKLLFGFGFETEEVGSPSQHALQLINIQNRNFLHYHLEKLWEFASIFR